MGGYATADAWNVKHGAGKERKVTGAVPREDALILQDMVRFVKVRTALETGVAFGLSALAICKALKKSGVTTDAADNADAQSPKSLCVFVSWW